MKPGGILLFGPNGSGKTTLGRALAQAMGFYAMDIEDYHFEKSEIPYTVARSQERCRMLLRADMEAHPAFVLSAVTGDFGEAIRSHYALAVWLSAPLDTRVARVRQRAYAQFGARVCEGGDLYASNQAFVDFVAARPLDKIAAWANTLSCPILRLDGTQPLAANIERIMRQYAAIRQ